MTQPYYKGPGNLDVKHVESVPLAISYHLYSLCVSKVLSSYIAGLSEKFTAKNGTFLHIRS